MGEILGSIMREGLYCPNCFNDGKGPTVLTIDVHNTPSGKMYWRHCTRCALSYNVGIDQYTTFLFYAVMEADRLDHIRDSLGVYLADGGAGRIFEFNSALKQFKKYTEKVPLELKSKLEALDTAVAYAKMALYGKHRVCDSCHHEHYGRCWEKLPSGTECGCDN